MLNFQQVDYIYKTFWNVDIYINIRMANFQEVSEEAALEARVEVKEYFRNRYAKQLSQDDKLEDFMKKE